MKMINENSIGLMHDILGDEGTNRWELIQTAVEQVIKDVQDFIGSADNNESQERNRDYLYGLINLLNTSAITDDRLLSFLSKDNKIYMPEVCGSLRIEVA